jgi:uncharacterized damage-inducible protein DinB
MDMEYLKKLFNYDDWANRVTVESLAAASQPPARSLALMAHIIAAEWLWMARLGHDAKKMAVWPELQLSECEANVADLRTGWRDYFSNLTPARLAETINYVNSKGERWSNNVQDILVHVAMHSAYHRGQIASELRNHGCTPAYTDFIEGVRRKSVV